MREIWQAIREEYGQTMAEYALILAVIGLAIVVTALIAWREAIVSGIDSLF